LPASIPATALFPIILLFLLRLRGGLELAAMLLMLLGTQWYILFNVIAGAIGHSHRPQGSRSHFSFWLLDRWRYLILPASSRISSRPGHGVRRRVERSIVAEYFHFQGRIVSTAGLGSTISSASDSGRFDVLLAATTHSWPPSSCSSIACFGAASTALLLLAQTRNLARSSFFKRRSPQYLRFQRVNPMKKTNRHDGKSHVNVHPWSSVADAIAPKAESTSNRAALPFVRSLLLDHSRFASRRRDAHSASRRRIFLSLSPRQLSASGTTIWPT